MFLNIHVKKIVSTVNCDKSIFASSYRVVTQLCHLHQQFIFHSCIYRYLRKKSREKITRNSFTKQFSWYFTCLFFSFCSRNLLTSRTSLKYMTESVRSANVMRYYYLCCTTPKLWWQYLLFSWISVRVNEENYVNVLEYQFKCIPMCRFFRRRQNCRYTTWFLFSILSVWLNILSIEHHRHMDTTKTVTFGSVSFFCVSISISSARKRAE